MDVVFQGLVLNCISATFVWYGEGKLCTHSVTPKVRGVSLVSGSEVY